jgi:hypothetical protein
MKVNIVFIGTAPNLTFVEVETLEGKSINIGEWVQGEKWKDGDNYSYLQLDVNADKDAELSRWFELDIRQRGEISDLQSSLAEARELLKEIYDWTAHKNTKWADRTSKFLGEKQ